MLDALAPLLMIFVGVVFFPSHTVLLASDLGFTERIPAWAWWVGAGRVGPRDAPRGISIERVFVVAWSLAWIALSQLAPIWALTTTDSSFSYKAVAVVELVLAGAWLSLLVGGIARSKH